MIRSTFTIHCTFPRAAFSTSCRCNHGPFCTATSGRSLPDGRGFYEAPPSHKPGKAGRPRKRGKRLPTPRQMLEGSAGKLTTLRCRSVRRQVLSLGLSGQGSRKVIETLEHAVRQAA